MNAKIRFHAVAAVVSAASVTGSARAAADADHDKGAGTRSRHVAHNASAQRCGELAGHSWRRQFVTPLAFDLSCDSGSAATIQL